MVLLPLSYFFKPEILPTLFLTILFYTILWLVLEIANKKILAIRKEEVMTTFALFIGVKFLVSILFLVFLFKFNLLATPLAAFAVFLVYSIFTFLMLKNNLMQK